jgi:2-phosphosulfolactate phosphatase
MIFSRATLDNCARATGTVVVIDVLRAFSTAAYAFAAGVSEILLVSEVEEAEALRLRFPGARITGEVGGRHVPGFDYGNSPGELMVADLAGRRLIQRTSAGTQGVVRSSAAEHLLAASLVCASATAEYVSQLEPEQVTFVITGQNDSTAWDADEDAACADYLEALIRGQDPNPEPFLARVRSSPTGLLFADPEIQHLPLPDLEYCLQINRFDFAMPVRRENGLVVLSQIKPG